MAYSGWADLRRAIPDGDFGAMSHPRGFGLARSFSAMNLLLAIVLIVLLIGALPAWPYSSGWGYYPSGGLGLVLIILLVLALTR